LGLTLGFRQLNIRPTVYQVPSIFAKGNPLVFRMMIHLLWFLLYHLSGLTMVGRLFNSSIGIQRRVRQPQIESDETWLHSMGPFPQTQQPSQKQTNGKPVLQSLSMLWLFNLITATAATRRRIKITTMRITTMKTRPLLVPNAGRRRERQPIRKK